MVHYSRRDFVKAGLAAGALASAGSLPLQAQRETELDTLLDPELKRILAKQDIRLISYRELN